MKKNQITLAITGASGIVYAFRLLECLLDLNIEVHLLISKAAREVAKIEIDSVMPDSHRDLTLWLQNRYQQLPGSFSLYSDKEWTSCVASGSGAPKQMVICPASMKTISAIACGASNNLIERAADVSLKERYRLLIVPRETPYSAIHLENMLKLTKMGAIIMPASPGFYYKNTLSNLIDFIIARILKHLDIKNNLLPEWGASKKFVKN